MSEPLRTTSIFLVHAIATRRSRISGIKFLGFHTSAFIILFKLPQDDSTARVVFCLRVSVILSEIVSTISNMLSNDDIGCDLCSVVPLKRIKIPSYEVAIPVTGSIVCKPTANSIGNSLCILVSRCCFCI